MPFSTRLLLCVALSACATAPTAPATDATASPAPDAPVATAEAPAEAPAASTSTEEAIATDYVKVHWRTPPPLIPSTKGRVGEFACYRVGPTGPFLYVSGQGVLTLDGQGDWRGFLVARPDTDATGLARAVVAMHADQSPILLLPTDPKPPTVSPEQWSTVKAPALSAGADGAQVLDFWMGMPSRYQPTPVRVTVPVTGRAEVKVNP